MPDLIWPSVRAAFVPFSARYEGVVPHLYQDCIGLVTIAIGCLVDPLPLALALPLVRADGTPASRDEIAAEWRLIKSHTELAHKGAGAARKLATLRLTDEGVAQVVGARLDATVAALARRFPELPTWPADAELGTLSLAWACGAGFRYPKLDAALRRQDWTTAADESAIRDNPPRTAAQRALYLAAAESVAQGREPSELTGAG